MALERTAVSRADRLGYSIVAIAVAWGLAGVFFEIFVQGPSTIAAWMIWGGAFCLLGWLAVGIPLVIAGDRIYRISPALLIPCVGLCGAILASLPFSIIGGTLGNFLTPGGLALEGMAFAIATLATLIYRLLLLQAQRGRPVEPV